MMQKIKRIKTYTFIVYIIETLVVLGLIIFKLVKDTNTTFVDNPTILFIIFSLIFGINIVVALLSQRSIEVDARINHIGITNTLGADISEAFIYGELGMIIFDSNQEIIWTSELFEERNIRCVGKNVTETFPEVKAFFDNTDQTPDEVKVALNSRDYSVLCLRELDLLVFKDTTEIDNLYEMKEKQAPVFITVAIDNLTDLESIGQDENTTQYELEVRKLIIEWGKHYDVYTHLIGDDVYLIVAQEEEYIKMVNDKFNIMDQVHEVTKTANIPLTISIGVGRGNSDFNRLAELSSSAMDVALSRGGGQIVINNYGAHMEFFGGTTEIKTKKNTVRSRVLSQSLYTHIKSNDKILLAPHTNADFDAIGACLGLYTMAKAQNKEAWIVCPLNCMEIKTRTAIKDLFKKEEIDDIFIDEAKALTLVDDKTLVCLADINRAKLTPCPKLIEVAQRIAVIDHHRRAEDAIDNPIFSIIETTASSASELVVELIKFSKSKINIVPRVATALLAGILLDTSGFRNKCSAETFEACMLLKEYGADLDAANDYLKDEYEEYELKTKIMNNAETIHFGIVLTTAPDDLIVDRTILAKVGNDAMNVKGIKAIFVIGLIGQNEVGVSARSDGSFNVQLILEKMGGGGHFAMAATQIKDKSIADVREELIKIVDNYISEMRFD